MPSKRPPGASRSAEVPWQVLEFVPDDETVEYADRAVLQRPWWKIRYHGWVALTDRALRFRGRTLRKEWVFPPTPTRWKEKHVPYDRIEEIARGDVSKARIRASGAGTFLLELARKEGEKVGLWNRRQARLIERLRERRPDADRGDKDTHYPFFRVVELPPHEAMNPRQARNALKKGGLKADRVIWEPEEE